MSSDEDHDGIPVPTKKRRVQRACDTCRKKKRACDGLRMSEKKCTYCIENGLQCTFAGAVTKRRSYFTSQNSNEGGNAPSPGSSQWSKDSPVHDHGGDAPAAPNENLGHIIGSMTIRTLNAPPPPSEGDDLAHIALVQDMHDLSLHQVQERFHGKSSGAMLVKAAVQLRQGYEEKDMSWPSRRLNFWLYDAAKDRPAVPHTGPFVFPPPDLLTSLISLYFSNKNIYFPVLHRPSFDRAVADGLHLRDAAFGANVLLVCAIAARFSDDLRVSPPGAEPLRCGWEYFDQLTLVLELFEPPTLYRLQFYCLATMFLEYSSPSACWTVVGAGIRVAQDKGAHREKCFGPRPTLEGELWRRNFWILVVFERLISTSLGRSCAIHAEDYDAEMPLEIDDEYWPWETDDQNPAPARAPTPKQPEGKPSRLAFFCSFLRLNNILAFALKMLYTLNKTKRALALRDPHWEEHIVAELDSALNTWVDSAIPAHLRWDPNRRDEVFFVQSAYLYCCYYNVQITIHRPFIPMVREGVAPTTLPSLAICTNAARSCSHVADIARLRRPTEASPHLLVPVFTSGLILLMNVWSGKRTGLPPHMNSAIVEVHKCMASIRQCERRWQNAGLLWDLLYNLAAIGQFPLPKTPPQQQSPNANKRAREHEDDDDHTGYPDAAAGPAPAVHYPPRTNAYHPVGSASHAHAHTTQSQQNSTPLPTLPTHTSELGRLPVYHQHTEDAGAGAQGQAQGWYSAPTAPAHAQVHPAPPNPPMASALDDLSMFNMSPLSAFNTGGYDGVTDPNLGGANMNDLSTDGMSMWANPPAGLEIEDWGTYFSMMTALNQGLDV
ncbi:fungal-specific transcription factor domain-containing protein [Mycena filopes]|nr:fungal-specific transcription factor domain-containing protein [Mycena filopes]